MKTNLRVNGKEHVLELAEDIPLLWVLRDFLGLKGAKYGCGVAMCGACTVHVDGIAMRSCSMPATMLEGADIVTIEGLSSDAGRALQRAWVDHEVSQCGYCQTGQIMQAAAVLQDDPAIAVEDLEAELYGNLCRCGTYTRIKAAIRTASSRLAAGDA